MYTINYDKIANRRRFQSCINSKKKKKNDRILKIFLLHNRISIVYSRCKFFVFCFFFLEVIERKKNYNRFGNNRMCRTFYHFYINFICWKINKIDVPKVRTKTQFPIETRVKIKLLDQ